MTAGRVDADVAVIGAGPAGLAVLVASKDPIAYGGRTPRS